MPIVNKIQEARQMLRNLHDAISSGGRKSIGNCLAAEKAVSYAEGVLTYRQAVGWYSLFRQKISKSTRVTIIY